MEGVAEDDFRTNFSDIARQHPLHSPIRPNRHKRGGLHAASRKIDLATSGKSIAVRYTKLH